MDVVNIADEVKAMIVEDYLKKKVVHVKEVDAERVQIYKNIIEKFVKAGTKINGIVVDGRSGVIPALEEYAPVQMCHFHFVAIVTRYLGKKRSKTFQSLVLKHLSRTALKMGQVSFSEFISLYEDMYSDYMNEKKINPETGRPVFAHKRIRQAFRTLSRFKDNLFTFEHVENMPNTTNSLDGKISATKAKINIHRGLKADRKVKLFKYLIKR
jgi:transposase-like protein